jgi:hypothetical protein
MRNWSEIDRLVWRQMGVRVRARREQCQKTEMRGEKARKERRFR